MLDLEALGQGQPGYDNAPDRPLAFATLAQLYATFARNRLPMDEFAKLVSGAQTVTAAKLQEVGRSRLHPEDATIVIVGDVHRAVRAWPPTGRPRRVPSEAWYPPTKV